MILTNKTYNTLINKRLLPPPVASACKSINFLTIHFRTCHARVLPLLVGIFLCLSVTLGSCEDYSDYLHSVMQSYLVESEKLDSAKTDSIIRFVAKVQRLTQAYPSLQKDPSYSQIMQNIPVASLNITITGATWKDEKTIELGEEKDEKNEKECNLQVANDLIDVSFRHILNFFLVINGEQVDACVSGFNQHIERDDPQASTFSAALALDSKADFTFPTTERVANIGILHQFLLQIVNIISQRPVAFCQSLSLTQELFGIVKCHHCSLYLSTEFLNQCVEGCEILACKPSLLSIFESTSDGVGDKSLLRFGSRVARHQLVDGHPFDSKQDLLQAWHEVRILNIQYNLGHEINL